MTNTQLQPFEPFWPYGTVAHFYTKRLTTSSQEVAMRELQIERVELLVNGWRVTARVKANQLDSRDREFTFEVDENGESPDCVPWDDELENEYRPKRKTYTEESDTVPIRLASPRLEVTEDTDIWADLDAFLDVKASSKPTNGAGGDHDGE